MGFRFWKRINIAPGAALNLSKSGGSLSFGPRGAGYTVGPRGQRVTAGIPGTGLFYTSTLPKERSSRRTGRSSAAAAAPEVPQQDRLTLGFFQRLVTPERERSFVDGCREVVLGNTRAALEHLEKAVDLADGAFLAGYLALKMEHYDKAIDYLSQAAARPGKLGRLFARYGVSATMSLPITDEVAAHVGPDLRGVLLALVEIHQHQQRRDEAIACLERLGELEPDDVVVKLSLAELLWDGGPGQTNTLGERGTEHKSTCHRIVALAQGIGNETPVHAALLLYQARALRRLGLPDAARATLTRALRRKKGRSGELLRALRYERMLVYEALGNSRRVRSELETLYAEDPGYEDVAERLGIAS